MSEIVSTMFTFKDFFKAFKIVAKIGYRNVDESNANKFHMLTQFLKKQLENYLAKNQPNVTLFNSLLVNSSANVQADA